ncbi:hypothetical protein ON010_g9742 [Phytophthora cinnamomi]|nr:hypothetical protein ON010_g9742 [Phytophthora cinnamomi]
MTVVSRHLSRRELGHGLRAFRHGVLGQLAREHEAHGRLDLAAGQRRLLVVARQLARLRGDALEDVVDERVHDRHAALADARLGVHLTQHLVDVGRVRLDALLALALAGLGNRLRGLLRGSLRHCCWRRRVETAFTARVKSRNGDLRAVLAPLHKRGKIAQKLGGLCSG